MMYPHLPPVLAVQEILADGELRVMLAGRPKCTLPRPGFWVNRFFIGRFGVVLGFRAYFRFKDFRFATCP